jgi:hypothetical protein
MLTVDSKPSSRLAISFTFSTNFFNTRDNKHHHHHETTTGRKARPKVDGH